MVPLKTKAEVDYSRGHAGSRCGVCVYFHHTTRTCDLVEGDIHPDMWCKLFEPNISEMKRAA